MRKFNEGDINGKWCNIDVYDEAHVADDDIQVFNVFAKDVVAIDTNDEVFHDVIQIDVVDCYDNNDDENENEAYFFDAAVADRDYNNKDNE